MVHQHVQGVGPRYDVHEKMPPARGAQRYDSVKRH